jgi:polyhydroxyalkanoate synthesis regulator phasin
MLIDRLISEVKIELEEAHKLLDELSSRNDKFDDEEFGEDLAFNNEKLLLETTEEIIAEQKNLLFNLKIDELATIISKVENRYTICPSCEKDISKNSRIVRLPHQSLIKIKNNPISPTEIVIIDICPHCNYILNFDFFKGNRAHKLYQVLIKDLSKLDFEFEEGLKV